MCAVREPAPPERGADSPQDQREATLCARWLGLLRGYKRLRLRRRLWGLIGGHLGSLAAADRKPQLRAWWGHYGNVLKEIKARGRLTDRDLPAAGAATRSTEPEPDEEPGLEPASSSRGSASTVVNINVNVTNHAVTARAGISGEERRRGRGRGR